MDGMKDRKVTATQYYITKLLYLHGPLTIEMIRLLMMSIHHTSLTTRTITNRLYSLQQMGLVKRLHYDWRASAPAPTLWGLDDTPTARKAFIGIAGKEQFDPLLWKSAVNMTHRFMVPCKRGFLESMASHDHIARNLLVSVVMAEEMIIDSLWPPENTIEFKGLDGRSVKIIPDLEIFGLFARPERLLVEVQNQTRPSKIRAERFKRYLSYAISLRQYPPETQEVQNEEETRRAQRAQAHHTILFVVRELKKLLPIYLDTFKKAMASSEFGNAGQRVAEQFTWLMTDSLFFEMQHYDFSPLPSPEDKIWVDLLKPERGKRALL